VIRVAHGKELIKILKKKSADLIKNAVNRFYFNQCNLWDYLA